MIAGRVSPSPSLSVSYTHSSSITQPRHEYKWRPAKSRDWVPVNGFLLGLRQQCSPNGFGLTGFNHVPWYPLKRMQIVNQTSLPFPHASTSLAAVFTLFPVIILPSFTLFLLSFFSSYSLLHISPTSCFFVCLDLAWGYWHESRTNECTCKIQENDCLFWMNFWVFVLNIRII